MRASLLLCLALVQVPVHSQLVIRGGDKLKGSPPVCDYYLDHFGRQAYFVEEGKARLIQGDCRAIRNWYDLAVLEIGDHYALGDHHGIRYKAIRELQMEDSILVVIKDSITLVLNAHGRVVSAMLMDNTAVRNRLRPDLLNGQRVYCLPQVVDSRKIYQREDYRNWGLMDGKGRWIIDPIYDKPFKFQDGIAKVEKYGRKMRIDAKGQVVE